jgi:hypothetical protein
VNTALRLSKPLLDQVHSDLGRPHSYAGERVGFVTCRVGTVSGGVLLLANGYLAVADDDYEDDPDPEVGAMMGPGAIRKALQHAYGDGSTMLHVHRHEHLCTPRFSPLDLREAAKFVPDFWKVRPNVPHGTIVLSHDSIFGLCWDPVTRKPESINQITIVGRTMEIFGRWWQ